MSGRGIRYIIALSVLMWLIGGAGATVPDGNWRPQRVLPPASAADLGGGEHRPVSGASYLHSGAGEGQWGARVGAGGMVELRTNECIAQCVAAWSECIADCHACGTGCNPVECHATCDLELEACRSRC